MTIKKHKVTISGNCYRIYWDGRAIQVDMLNSDFDWEIYASLYKKKSFGFQLKIFKYYNNRGYKNVSYYTEDYNTAAIGIKQLEKKLRDIRLPEEVREFLDAYDTMNVLND